MFTYNRDKEPLKAGAVARYAAAAGLVGLAMLVYVYPSIVSTSLMYEYSEKYRALEGLRERNKQLKLEISTLRSLDYVERRAIDELGFTFPAPGQVVIIAKK